MFKRSFVRSLTSLIAKTTWRTIFAAYAFHFTFSWISLHLSGETFTNEPINFVWYFVVSSSTVGFGDIAPLTQPGRLISALFLIPSSLILFSTTLSKIVDTIREISKKMIDGNVDLYGLKNHIIIIGWIPDGRTKKLASLLQSEGTGNVEIAIISDNQDLKHPMMIPNIHFVKVGSYSCGQDLERLNVHDAKSIIVNTGSDSENYMTCISLQSKLKDSPPHIVVYMEDENKQEILEATCKDLEVISLSQEQFLSRAAMDAGSSSVSETLINPHVGATQHSMRLPESIESVTFQDLFLDLKSQVNVYIIGFSDHSDKLGRNIKLNPDMSQRLSGGMYIHFIANTRITENEINWNEVG